MRRPVSMFFAGAAWGSGITLFSLYLLSGAIPFTLAGWPRLIVALSGLVLWITGLVAGRRLTPRGEAKAHDVPGTSRMAATENTPV